MTHKVKTQQVVRIRGQRCGDIDLTSYLANETVPVPLVLDLCIAHDRFGSSSDPSFNGHLHYPNDIDRSLNEVDTDKIRKYRSDYNNNPPSSVSSIPTIVNTSGRLHGEFVHLLFLQVHRETDLYFAVSVNILAKAAALRITLKIDTVNVSILTRTSTFSPRL